MAAVLSSRRPFQSLWSVHVRCRVVAPPSSRSRCCCPAASAGALAEDDILFERETPYVPTPQDVVERMLDMAKVKPGEYLIDLGSGDGRIVVTAAQRGARAYGVDLNPEARRRKPSPTPPRPASAIARPSR